PGIRRSERSRGVAERSTAGGVGGEVGSKPRSFGGEKYSESTGTDRRDRQSERALQKDRAGSRSRGPPAGAGLPRSAPGSAARNHFGPGCYRRSVARKAGR